MELYFTRHGKTQWNDEMRFQGREGDSPLLAESYDEIQRLGQRLKDIPFEKVYCSSLKRTVDTAQGIIAQLKNPVELILVDDLREIGLGNLEGAPIATARKIYGESLEAMRTNPAAYRPEEFGGETFASVIHRNERAVLAAVKYAEKGPILFVGHGASLTATIQHLTGKSLNELREMGGLTNSSLCILETNGAKIPPFQLKMWDDTSHLKS